MNTKHLRAFAAVAETGSIVRASQAIQRVQSAVARSVQELERECGVPLFERRAQGMLLTEFGRVLLARVERAFVDMEAARNALKLAHPALKAIAQAPIFSLSIGAQRMQVFLELVEQRHMGAVADSLGISQPGASQAIRDIEAATGIKLFLRGHTGMEPTPSVVLLAAHIHRALAEIRAAEADISALQAAVSGQVIVGTFSSLGRTRLLPAAIIRLVKLYPNLTVSTIEAPFEHLTARLRAGDVDFVLGALRETEHATGLVRHIVVEDELALVVGRSHPLARRRKLSLSDLSSASWILPQRRSPTRELLKVAFRAEGLGDPKVAVETADPAITSALLQESQMVSAVSLHLYHQEIRGGKLSILPLALPQTRRPIGILQRSSSNPSPAARLLIDHILAIGKL